MSPITEKDWMDIAQYFYLTDERLQRFSNGFTMAVESALAGRDSSLRALKSYLPLPTGEEAGAYIALDFGGTNVRASRIRLLGNHCYIVEKKISRPLKREGSYDYLSHDTTAVQLFDFIAALVGEAAGGNKPYKLGHTFSFAVSQQQVRDARLLQWSKEIAVAGVEGEEVNELLRLALRRGGLDKIEPVALLNDTTAVLLASSYQHGKSQLAVICGTGFNICYYEPSQQMILSLEAGNYTGAEQTIWDVRVDAESRRPGCHQLEKMVGGAYLNNVFRNIAMTYFNTTEIPFFTTQDMNGIIMTENMKDVRLRMGRMWKRLVPPEDVRPLRNLGAAVFVRAAQLSGAACFGVLRHLYPDGDIPRQTLAVEGSVLEHVRGGLLMMEDALRACQSGYGKSRSQSIPAEPSVIKDGPSVGAAIAAAMSSAT